MYRYKNAFKKTTALIVAAVIVLSIFSGSFSSLATTLGVDFEYSHSEPGNNFTNFTFLDSLSQYKLPAEIIGSPSVVVNDGKTTKSSSVQNNARLTDYNFADAAEAIGTHFYTLKDGQNYNSTSLNSIKEYNNGAYTQIVIPFKTPIKLEALVVANMHRDNAANWRTGKYAIFASSNRGDLFLPESQVHVRDNTTDKNQIELYSFKNGKELRYISYIALRVYQPHAAYDLRGQSLNNGIKVRLFEFNAYGTPENTDYNLTQNYTVKYDTDSINEDHTVKTVGTKFTSTIDGNTKTILPNEGDKIFDYNIDTSGWIASSYKTFFDPAEGYEYSSKTADAIGVRHVNGLNKTTGNDQYVTIETEFLGEVDVEDILVVNHKKTYLMTGQYEIYASKTKADLYDKDSLVARFDNSSSRKQIQDFHFDTDKELKNIKYVAMRILNPISEWFTDAANNLYKQESVKGAIYPRLFEFNVYGTWSDPNFDAGDSTINLNDKSIDKTKTFAWDSARFEFTDENGTVSVSMDDAYKAYDRDYTTATYMLGKKAFYDLKDGAAKSSKDINDIKRVYNDGSRYLTVILEAETEVDLSDIVIVNHKNPLLATKSYEVYASGDRSTLFDPDSLEFTYNNYSGFQIQNLHYDEGKELKNIKYIALRIYDPVNSWDSDEIKEFVEKNGISQIYPRIMEFNAYGVYSDPNYQPPPLKVYNTMANIDTNNILQKIFYVSFTKDGKSKEIGWDDQDNLTDGDVEKTGKEFYYTQGTQFFDIVDGYDVKDIKSLGTVYTDGSRYLDLTYELPTEITVSDILVGQHTKEKLMLGKYAIYVSSKRENLYTVDNLVAEYDGKSHSAQIQDFHWSEGNEPTGVKYVGMRITDPFANWDDAKDLITDSGIKSLYPRLMEFDVYGKYEDANYQPSPIRVYNNKNNIDTSNTLQKFAFVNFTKDGESTKIAWADLKKVTDGSEKTGTEFFYSNGTQFFDIVDGYDVKDIKSLGTIYTDGSRYLDLMYKFPTEVNVSDILVAHHSKYLLGNYQIYASAKLDNLYDKSNLIGEYDSDIRSSQIQDFHWKDGKELKGIKYVGLRITNPFADWELAKGLITDYNIKSVYPRLMEFDVYGEYADPTYVPVEYTDTKDFGDLSKLTEYGANLIAQTDPIFRADGKRAAVKPAAINKVKKQVSTPPANDTIHCDLDDNALKDKGYIDIQWKLTDEQNLDMYRVNGFAFRGHYGKDGSNPKHYTSHYQIYVAEDVEDLYNPENMVFEYNAEEIGDMSGLVYEFSQNDAPVGSYIALRILDPASGATDNVNPRISIFYVWGEDPMIIPEPTNLAENMPIDAYFSAKKMEEISEENLTAKEVMNMTDADEGTVAKINTKNSNRKTTEIIYNLCGDMIVDNISLTTLINSSTGFKTLKVYASNALAGTKFDSALIWSQKIGDKRGEVKLSKTISSDEKIRYVRFVFEGCKDYLQINTINVEGLDNQKNKTRELTTTLDPSTHFSVVDVNLETEKRKLLDFESDDLASLIDGYVDTYTVVSHEGVVGKNEYEFTIKLDDLRTINTLKLSFLYGFDEYYPNKINIYLAEVADEIEGKNARTEPDYVVTKKDIKNNVFEKAMRPRLVRYIKFEYKDFSRIEGFRYANSNEYQLVSIIPEMSFKGTKVKGMNTSNDAASDDSEIPLISFEDKETGIKADIMRHDKNDIFTDAVDIKVTPETATNWQMMSLKNNPYLKVVDKLNYKVEFVDILGNVVSDLGGRNVNITFTVPEGENVDEFMVGESTLRTKMVVQETTPKNRTVLAHVMWNSTADNKYSLLQMVNEDDPYWDTIGALEDFSEGTDDDLEGDFQADQHDEEWYKTIRTEDGRFEVTGVDNEILTDVMFTATDVSKNISDEMYGLIAQISGGKQVAVIYDFNFTLNDEPYIHEGVVDVKLNLPDFIKDNYTDLQVIHLIDESTASLPWCETIGDEFYFQTESFSNFVIIGTALNDSVGEIIGVGDGTFGDDYLGDENSPATGESGITVPVLMFIVAAAFVIISTTRKKVR